MGKRHRIKALLVCGAIMALGAALPAQLPTLPAGRLSAAEPTSATSPSTITPRHRSPVDLALSPDGAWLATANQSSDSLSFIRANDFTVVQEIPCGAHPAALVWTPDGERLLVTAAYDGKLSMFSRQNDQWRPAGELLLGYDPCGVAVTSDSQRAYVALTAANEVAEVDLAALTVKRRIAVGKWPRHVALSPDGATLAVGANGGGGISVVDLVSGTLRYEAKFLGINIGHLQTSRDGAHVYFPWMVYADRPITPGNIREGWVLGNRVGRVRLDVEQRREAIALDPRGQAVADPHGMAVDPAEKWLAITAPGTHELVLLRMSDAPWSADGVGDHMKPELVRDDQRFVRIPLGGRPLAVRFDSRGERAYVANYLADAVQVVDIAGRRVERTIALCEPVAPSLARQGEAIFYDAHRSTDGWYSCHSCHQDGGTNAVTMDTKNDGSVGTYKMVLSLRNLPRTGPWFWHGWQTDYQAALRQSLVETMQGPKPSDDDVEALAAFLAQLPTPPNPHRQPDGSLSPAAARGQRIFQGTVAACATCHSGPYATDGQIHDVGLGSQYDKYEGYNTPSLVGIANRVGYLHHGRAATLEEALTDLHSPDKVSGTRPLTPDELADLVEYLKSL